MPFGVTAAVTSGLVAAGVGEATAGILAAGLVDAGSGALIGGGISALSGGNVGHGAAMGALGGALAGGGGAALEDFAPETAASLGLGSAGASGASGSGTSGAAGVGTGPVYSPDGSSVDISGGNVSPASGAFGSSGDASSQFASGLGAPNLINNIPTSATDGLGAAATSDPSTVSQIGSYLGKQNPLNLALAGGSVLSGVQALLPKKKVDVAQNAADTIATNPGFNGSLPKYTTQNTASPYTGDWYKYGFTPQPVLYNGQPTLQQARGGLVGGYARGGKVKGYAMGGIPSPQPGGTSPLAAMMPQQPSGMPAGGPPSGNPLMAAKGFDIGKAIGQHLQNSGALNNVNSPQAAYLVGHSIGKRLKPRTAPKASPLLTPPGQVVGAGGGQDDAIPAKLSDGEFIIPADVVSKLGDGSTNAGGKKLTQMLHQVRAQKAVKGFPPKAKKNPLSYIPKDKA